MALTLHRPRRVAVRAPGERPLSAGILLAPFVAPVVVIAVLLMVVGDVFWTAVGRISGKPYQPIR